MPATTPWSRGSGCSARSPRTCPGRGASIAASWYTTPRRATGRRGEPLAGHALGRPRARESPLHEGRDPRGDPPVRLLLVALAHGLRHRQSPGVPPAGTALLRLPLVPGPAWAVGRRGTGGLHGSLRRRLRRDPAGAPPAHEGDRARGAGGTPLSWDPHDPAVDRPLAAAAARAGSPHGALRLDGGRDRLPRRTAARRPARIG
jgi:hypothetical protein